MDNDLYNILELSNEATLIDIKKNFKKLALKYHPDKNKNKNNQKINYNEKFNQIRIAYEILSNHDKKSKYDKMNQHKKQNFIDTLFQFLKKITDPQIIHNIMLRPDIMNDIKVGDINIIAQNLIHKILDNIDLNIDMKELEEVFIHTPNKNNTSESNILSTPDYNTLNIFGKISINIEDVYHNNIKEITIKRKVYKQNEIINNETLKYNIPLYDNKIIISEAGDKIINDKSNIEIGNAILKLKYICPSNILKDNYDIIFNHNMTMYELFYGFNKQITYFNTIIDICSGNPLSEYSFNGEYISISIKDKGLPYDQDNNRGNLIINLYLIKDDDFEHRLKTSFN